MKDSHLPVTERLSAAGEAAKEKIKEVFSSGEKEKNIEQMKSNLPRTETSKTEQQ